jgi:hypothetical protein
LLVNNAFIALIISKCKKLWIMDDVCFQAKQLAFTVAVGVGIQEIFVKGMSTEHHFRKKKKKRQEIYFYKSKNGKGN